MRTTRSAWRTTTAHGWYALEYLALFGFVLLHEFGHVLACRSVGGSANRIILWPLGGVAFVDPPPRPGALLWSIAAGPLVNLLLRRPPSGSGSLVVRPAGRRRRRTFTGSPPVIAWINGYLLLFNLLPVYPLDGGKILQALLWFVMGRARSLLVATAIGLLTALGLLLLAISRCGSLVWGIMAGLGLLFCLLGLQGARGVDPHAGGAAADRRRPVPPVGLLPPRGNFWACTALLGTV